METCTLDIQLQFDPVQLWIRKLRPVSFVFSLKRPYFGRKSKSIGSNWRNTIRLIRVIGPRHAPVNRWNTVVSRWFDNSIPFFFFLFFFSSSAAHVLRYHALFLLSRTNPSIFHSAVFQRLIVCFLPELPCLGFLQAAFARRKC